MSVNKILLYFLMYLISLECNAQDNFFTLKQTQASCLYNSAIKQILENQEFIGIHEKETFFKRCKILNVKIDTSNLLEFNDTDKIFFLCEKNIDFKPLKSIEKIDLNKIKPYKGYTFNQVFVDTECHEILNFKFSKLYYSDGFLYFKAFITYKSYNIDNSYLLLSEIAYFEVESSNLKLTKILLPAEYSEPNIKLVDSTGKLNKNSGEKSGIFYPSKILKNCSCKNPKR